MKILLIVVLALISSAHCEEAEEKSEKYLFQNDISETGTNQIIANNHRQILAIPEAQSHQYIKNSRPTYQLQQNPSYGNINPASVSYRVTYQSYPQTVKTFENVPVKQNGATQFIDFANLPQSNYLASYQMVAPKKSKFFVDSSQIYEKNNAGFGLNSYGSNQYKFAEQYNHKPTTWTGVSNGVTNGFVASGNGLKTTEGYPPVFAGYEPASTNGNGFKTVKDYSSLYSGHVIPSSNGYPVDNIDVASTFVSNGYRNPKLLSYGPTNVDNELQYTNVAQPVQYIKPEYKPVMESEYGSGIVNGVLTTKTPEFIPYGKKHMYVVPKEYVSIPNEYSKQNFGNFFMYIPKSTNVYSTEYSSVPSFQSSLRDIVRMVNEEQRKSKEKAIFLIGKPQFPRTCFQVPVDIQYHLPNMVALLMHLVNTKYEC